MKLKSACFLLMFLSFFAHLGLSQTQFNWNDRTQTIYESITSLRIPEARRLNAIEKKNAPNNLTFVLLDNYADLFQLFFNENETEYNTLYPNFDKRLEILKTGPKNSPFYLFSQAMVHLNKAIVAIRFDKNWDAALDFRKSYLLFKQNKEAFPKFTPNNLYFGLLTTVIGSVPNNYQWMLNILGMKGSISEGNAMVLNYINSKDSYSYMCRNEALLFYPYLVLNFEANKSKAFDFINTTNYDFNKNHLHAYMATNIFLGNQSATKSLEISNGIEINDNYLKLPFWNYEKGFAYLNLLELDKAQKELTQFTSTFRGRFYLKDAYEKLSWIAYLKNDLKKANNYRLKVIREGSLVTDADKLSHANALSGKWPNTLLLKAKLLSDGGMQSQALNLLLGKSTQNFLLKEEKAEFVYRLARIHDLSESKEQAIKYYKTAIELGKDLKEYYASRAALQLGILYEERKDYDNAISFYTTCLELKNTALKNSIDQKAKAGLQRCQRNRH